MSFRAKLFLLSLVLLAFLAGGAVVYLALLPAQNSNQLSSSKEKPSTTKEKTQSEFALNKVSHQNRVTLSPQENEVHEIVQLLSRHHSADLKLDPTQLNPSMLPLLMERSKGALVLKTTSLKTASHKVAKTDVITPNIVYWQPTTLNENSLDQFLQSWEQFKKIQPQALVLDLRNLEATNDYSAVAEVAGLWISPQTPLFSIQGARIAQEVFQTTRQPLDLPRPFPLIVLVNARTSGAGEVLAMVLRRFAGALVIGNSTAGECAWYEEHRLASGRYLRVATATVFDADSSSMLNQPVIPDIMTGVPLELEDQALDWLAQKGVQSAIQELPVRKRVNEASLVKQEDVEITMLLANQAENINAKQDNLTDTTLKHALDILQALQRYQPAPVK